MIRINLLPVREARRKATQRQQAFLLGGAVGAGLVAALLVHLAMQARIASTRSRIEATKQELAGMAKTLGDVEEFREKKKDIQQKLSVIKDLEVSRIGPVRVMDEIATRIPERVWLKSLSIKAGLVEMEGFALDNELIAAFMTSLEQSDHLMQVDLLKSDLEGTKSIKLNRFQVRARLERAGPQAETAETSGSKGESKRASKRKGGSGKRS